MLTRGRRGCFVYAELLCSGAARARAVVAARRRCIRLLVMWSVGDAGKRVMCGLSSVTPLKTDYYSALLLRLLLARSGSDEVRILITEGLLLGVSRGHL
jgi:hypothetical protein